jgi:hypothetical protein
VKVIYLLWALTAFAVAVIVIAVVNPHGVVHFIGIDTQQSDNYAFFSGFGSWLSSNLALLGLATLVGTAWRAMNCHVYSCNRLGRYPIVNGQFKVCKKHHPDETVRKRNLAVEDLHRMHRDM